MPQDLQPHSFFALKTWWLTIVRKYVLTTFPWKHATSCKLLRLEISVSQYYPVGCAELLFHWATHLVIGIPPILWLYIPIFPVNSTEFKIFLNCIVLEREYSSTAAWWTPRMISATPAAGEEGQERTSLKTDSNYGNVFHYWCCYSPA